MQQFEAPQFREVRYLLCDITAVTGIEATRAEAGVQGQNELMLTRDNSNFVRTAIITSATIECSLIDAYVEQFSESARQVEVFSKLSAARQWIAENIGSPYDERASYHSRPHCLHSTG